MVKNSPAISSICRRCTAVALNVRVAYLGAQLSQKRMRPWAVCFLKASEGPTLLEN